MSASANAGGFFDGHKIGAKQRKFLWIVAWAYVFEQMDIINFGFIAPTLIRSYGWTMQDVANVNSWNFVGMFLGAFFGGWFSDKIGRKKALLITIFLFSVSSLTNALHTSPVYFCIMRFITGFGAIGLVTIAMVYISEMMPAETRGKYQALTISMGTIGLPVCALFGRIVIPLHPEAWRAVFLLGGLGIVLLIFGTFMLKESPRWMVSKGRIDEAAKLLDEIMPGAKLPENAVEISMQKGSGYIETFKTLFSMGYIKRTITLFMVVTGCTVGYFYSASFYPTVHAQMGFSALVVLNLALFQNLANPIGDFLVSFFSDKGGRKGVIATYFLIVAALYFTQGMFSAVLPISILLVVKSLFVAGSYTLMYTYLAESFPTNIRASASGILFGSGRLLNAVVMGSLPFVFTNFGYFGVNAVSGFFFLVPAIVVLAIGERTANVNLEKLNSAKLTV